MITEWLSVFYNSIVHAINFLDEFIIVPAPISASILDIILASLIAGMVTNVFLAKGRA